jgi:hypothetical protein
MTEPLDPEKRSTDFAAEGQLLVNAWHKRLSEAIPPPIPKDDDPKRGCVSPLGGKVW